MARTAGSPREFAGRMAARRFPAKREGAVIRRPAPESGCGGFSVTELLVALTIAAVTMTFAAPAFSRLIDASKLNTTVNDFFVAINLTRSEAVQRGRRVDLVAAGASGDWREGWIILIDSNDNHRHDADETVIASRGPVATGVAVTQRFVPAQTYLAFNAGGRSRSASNSQQPRSGSWLFEVGGQQRKVIINFGGRVRVCDPVADPLHC